MSLNRDSVGGGLPPSLGQLWGNWTHNGVQGVPVAAEWTPVGGWCDLKGSLPPLIARHIGDTASGRVNSPGQVLQSGSIFSNVTVVGNRFLAPASFTPSGQSPSVQWANAFVVLGNVDKGLIGNNIFVRTVPASDGDSDVMLFANDGMEVQDNRCVPGTDNGTSSGTGLGAEGLGGLSGGQRNQGGCVLRNNSFFYNT
jgi:hypothetical protein